MIQLLGIRALTAPNIWGTVPVLECRLVCEPISDDLIDAVFQRLEHAPQPTHLMDRRQFPTAAHAIVELCLALQRSVDCPVVQSEVRPTGFVHVWQLAFEIEQESVGRAALESACQLLSPMEDSQLDSVDVQLHHLRRIADSHGLGKTTRVLIATARQRGIPVCRLDEESLLQLGQGARQHRLRLAATDRTGRIAEWISRDKLLTKQLLHKAGIPVASGRLAADADDAVRAALELGAAIVVKPCDADYGEGVSVNLTDPSEIRSAYEAARKFSEKVLVERFLPGFWHRLLIVDGRLTAAARKEPPHVTADGRRTLAELIEEFNADPRRGFDDEFPLAPIVVGATVLGALYRQGYSLDSVPAAGTTVCLRHDAYLSSGATQSDVTDEVHPEIAELAVFATETIGLDVAGVDLICADISRPLAEQSLGVLELNAEPAIVVHMAPFSNPPRPVAERIVASLFPPGEDGRIPVVIVVGDLPLAQELTAHLHASGRTAGLAANNLVSVNGRSTIRREISVSAAAEALWMQRRVDAAVIHLTLADVLCLGMPVDQCDLLCLARLDVAEDRQKHGLDDWNRALSLLLQTKSLARDVLIHINSPTDCGQIPWPVPAAVLVSALPGCSELRQHAAMGGRTVIPENDKLTLHASSGKWTLAGWQPELPLLETAAKAWISRFVLSEPCGRLPAEGLQTTALHQASTAVRPHETWQACLPGASR